MAPGPAPIGRDRLVWFGASGDTLLSAGPVCQKGNLNVPKEGDSNAEDLLTYRQHENS